MKKEKLIALSVMSALACTLNFSPEALAQDKNKTKPKSGRLAPKDDKAKDKKKDAKDASASKDKKDKKPVAKKDKKDEPVIEEVIEEKPQIETYSLVVSAADAKAAGLNVVFKGNEIAAVGSLPAECAQRLSVNEARKIVSEESDNLDLELDSDKKSSNDIASHASKAGISLSFAADASVKSLPDCLKKFSSSPSLPVDLSRPVVTSEEAAVAGYLDRSVSSGIELSSGDSAKSKGYRRLEALQKRVNCKSCNETPSGLAKTIDVLTQNGSSVAQSWLTPLYKSSVENAINDAATARDFSTADQLLSKLTDLSKKIAKSDMDQESKNNLLSQVKIALSGLAAKDEQFLKADDVLASKGKARRVPTTDHLEFRADLFHAISRLPGISPEDADEADRLSQSYEVGGEARIATLLTSEPAHKEIVEYASDLEMGMKESYMIALRQCSGPQAMWGMGLTLCNRAKNNFQQVKGQYDALVTKAQGGVPATNASTNAVFPNMNGSPNGSAPGQPNTNGTSPAFTPAFIPLSNQTGAASAVGTNMYNLSSSNNMFNDQQNVLQQGNMNSLYNFPNSMNPGSQNIIR